MRASFLLALILPLSSAAPAPFDAKHKHEGNDTRNQKMFENSQIDMGDLTVDTATGDNMQIGHTLDINVVQSHGVISVKENDNFHGNTPAPAHSQDGETQVEEDDASIRSQDQVDIDVETPSLQSVAPPTESAGTTGGGNGEQVCEGHRYGKDKCESIGCCMYEDGQCWSSVGTATCVQSGGSGGALDGPMGPTVPGTKCTVKVTFPKKTSPVSKYPMFTTVFGIGLMGSGISDEKFQHLASQLALWIDNDEDGCPDTPEVVTWMVKQKIVQWFGPGEDKPNNLPDWEAIEKAGYKVGSALCFDNEINPSCSGTAGNNGCFDASIEEIFHVVTADGYAKAFPKVFSSSSSSNSKMTKAMDVARGGKFISVPTAYPSSAWYTYYDKTCGYGCQAIEYIYWAVTAYVGALDKRTDVIPEWRYNTKDKLVAGDKLVTAIIEDKTKYRLPTVAPNGDYRGCGTCSTGVVHGGN